MKKLLLLTVLCLSMSSLMAQRQAHIQEYERGKQLVEYGNWEGAMESLRPYLEERQFGDLSLFAHYHFARAAYGNGQYRLAMSTIQPLLDNRNWKDQDEAKYLMALAHFGQGNNEEALDLISKIENPQIKKEGEKATFEAMRDANLSWMLRNLKKYENNKGLALAIQDQLERKTVMSADDRRAYHEVRELSKNSDGKSTAPKRQENQILEIAVVLPFNYNGGSGVSQLSGNNFVFEYYQGLKMAVEEAQKAGLEVKMRTFDTERKTNVVERILEDPFVRRADIIIGPIYPEETTIVAVFAEQNGIPHINPLSNLDDNLKVAESAYLFRPSTKAMSEGIMDYVNRKSLRKRVGIAHSGASKDEMLAKQVAEDARRKGFNVVKLEKISGQGVREFFSSLGVHRGGEQAEVDMIIVLSDDPNVASPTFSVIESLNAQIPVLVPDTWLYFNFANFEMMEHQNIHFIGNNTVNFHSNDLEEFRDSFFEQYQTFPGIFAHLGYETVYWVQENLNPNKGFDFARNLNRAGFQEGKLTFGFNFENGRSNQFVPIMRLERGTLELE